MRLHGRALAALVLLTGSALAQAADITVYAAASLGNALKEIAAAYQARHPQDRIKASYASSATLAKQIEAGAPADLFASADQKWMDYLADRKRIAADSRRNLLGNALVLIAPASEPRTVATAKGQVPTFTGKLCMGDPASVPAGLYGRQALTALGWWPALEKRVVGTEDVRTALAFVERGECPLGIVYETDARISGKVMVAGRFPAGTHAPIVYPFALLPLASPAARAFYDYVQGPDGQRVFARHGFVILHP